MRRKLIALSLTAFALVLASGLPAPAQWRSFGPEGGTIQRFEPVPGAQGTVIAATQGGGLFRSTDSGQNWSPLGIDAMQNTFPFLAVAPSNPARIYFLSVTTGILRSTDAGATWKERDGDGLLEVGDFSPSGLALLRDFAISPASSNLLLVALIGEGIFRSTDGGNSWVQTLSTASVRHLAFANGSSKVIAAGDSSSDGWTSTDGGATWTDVGVFLGFEISDIGFDPFSTDTALASGGGTIQRSTDAGQTWEEVYRADQTIFRDGQLAFDPLTSGTVYVSSQDPQVLGEDFGLYRSTDGGDTWERLFRQPDGTVLTDLAVDASSPQTLYLGYEGQGVRRSTDGGLTFERVTSGLQAAWVNAVAVDPARPERIFAATDGGLHLSNDHGLTWSLVEAPFGDRAVFDIAIDPSNPDRLYAAPHYHSLQRSTDGGETWHFARDGLLASNIDSIAVAPSEPSTLYATSLDWQPQFAVARSTDGGDSWEHFDTDAISAFPFVSVDPQDPNRVFAGHLFGRGIVRSTDRGETWTAFNDGLRNFSARTVAVDPRSSSTVFAGGFPLSGSASVFQSTDGGVSWHPRNSGLGHRIVHSLVFHPTDPDTLFAGTSALFSDLPETLSAFRSTNRGETWEPFVDGLEHSTQALAVDPTNPERIYAGTSGGGVYVRLQGDEPCVPSATTLCLEGGRFEIRVDFRGHDGVPGEAQVAVTSDDSGVLYFFAEDNWEFLVKIIEACDFNGRYWLYAAATTDVEYTVYARDSETGETQEYFNPLGMRSPAITDVEAFATCP